MPTAFDKPCVFVATGEVLAFGWVGLVTGVDFLFGDGGADELFRSDGTLFGDGDGGVVGDDFRQALRDNDSVWYYNATGTNDVISVDFVTEPGVLSDRHLITRLTDNNGNFTFDAQIRLDFDARDEDGRLIWDPEGGADNDLLLGGFGSDMIFGDNPADSVEGADRIVGGPLNDVIFAGVELGETDESDSDSEHLIDGGSGDDRILGDRGRDTVRGGAGQDDIRTGEDDVTSTSDSSFPIENVRLTEVTSKVCAGRAARRVRPTPPRPARIFVAPPPPPPPPPPLS